MDKDQAKEILILINTLQKIDPNAIENLRKLVKMAQENPIKYNMALKFL